MWAQEDLPKLIASGNNEAFRRLYDLFKDRVYNTCLSYLQHTEEAEEATQDVFVKIHRSAAGFKGDSSVSTWIYRLAVNQCLDLLRFRNRQKRFAFISSLFGAAGNLQHDAPTFEHPGILAENRERAALLFKAIKQLPENQQTAFILKQAEGLSQKEVAEIMDITEKALESLLQRAKANLRKLLTEQNK